MIQNLNTTSNTSPIPGYMGPKRSPSDGPKSLSVHSIIIEKGKMRISIPIQNLLFVRAEHVYCRIFFSNDQKILQRVSIERLLSKLPAGKFLRVHRSFIVNLSYVEHWSGTEVIISGVTIPIGRTRRNEVVRRLKELK